MTTNNDADDTIDPKYVDAIERIMIAEDKAMLTGAPVGVQIDMKVEVVPLDAKAQEAAIKERIEQIGKQVERINDIISNFPSMVQRVRTMALGIDQSRLVQFEAPGVRLSIVVHLDLSVKVNYQYEQVVQNDKGELIDTELVIIDHVFTSHDLPSAIRDFVYPAVTKLLAAIIADGIVDAVTLQPNRQPRRERIAIRLPNGSKVYKTPAGLIDGSVGTLYGMTMITDEYDPSAGIDMKRIRRYFQKRKAQARARTGRRR